ncbi:DNA replication and repair protein RecF [Rhodopseudomonas julia]|uniref:DNA replication and repair protein RecF n=1 Tax=Rhodopseudomonas julia TaxID=200617 RepID=A0ABU0C5M9_9BRAD|nr:DNA replication/repair protein RecF [Rhodopseudomonas julia]MDQ0325829.1 DNA replication and repair protein RecF [Rhodopseudomonas julia]
MIAAPAALQQVTLASVKLTDFRNYKAVACDLRPGLVVLTGRNGSGKTNLLEAVSFLSPGRGLRRAKLGSVARTHGAGGWAVAADIAAGEELRRVGTGLRSAEEASREVRVDGATAPSSEALSDYCRVLWLTPAMDGLFTGAPGDRRRFLDRLTLAIDPGHGARVRAFDRLVSSRNRLLEDDAGPRWLSAVEAELAEAALAVSLARQETVSLLAGLIASHDETSAFPSAGLALQGDFEEGLVGGRSASEAEEAYRAALASERGRDRAAKRTLSGPHRSDLAVTFAAKNAPAALSSTGEQKALLLAIILAEAELVARVAGMTPILLLDEVAAHLDEGRRAALLARLEALGGQSFLTGTDKALFSAVSDSGQFIEVVEGQLSQT